MKNPYEILEINSSASESEIKKAYRNLAKKYHPDQCKDANASEKFKEIQTAYEELTNPKKTESNFSSIEDFNPFGFNINSSKKIIQYPPLQISIELNFIESVLGCKKNIKLSRQVACEKCNGLGGHHTIDKCKICNGNGKTFHKNGHMTFISPCEACQGFGKEIEKCFSCQGNGTILSEKKIDVNIPGGVNNLQIIRLPGAGHYQSTPFGSGMNDAFINIKVVKSNENMTLEDFNVISSLEITLLEALQGSTKLVQTVHGESSIEIPKLTKNNDKVCKVSFGANNGKRIGDHIFIINVKYPDNVDELIQYLERK